MQISRHLLHRMETFLYVMLTEILQSIYVRMETLTSVHLQNLFIFHFLYVYMLLIHVKNVTRYNICLILSGILSLFHLMTFESCYYQSCARNQLQITAGHMPQ